MSRTSPRRRTLGAALVVLALALSVLVGVSGPASAADGQVTGTVTGDDSGHGLGNITVRAYGSDLVEVRSVATEADGTYVLPLPPGTYRIGFGNPTSSYADEYWNDAPTLDTATAVVVPDGGTAVADAGLSPARSIRGRVTTADGALQGAFARAFQLAGDSWVEVTLTSTDAAGAYELSGLRAGTYRIGFADSAGSAVAEYFDDATSVATATDVPVGDADVTDVDGSLAPAGRVQGRVTSREDGAGVSGVDIVASRLVDGVYRPVADGSTNLVGAYDVGSLPTGAYRMTFTAPGYVAGAVRADVVAGASTGGADVVLTPVGFTAPSSPATSPPATTSAVITVLRQPRAKTRELVVGRKARLVPGAYPPGTTVSYAWTAGGKRVSGVTRPALRLTAALRTKRIRVVVTATLPGAPPVVTTLRFPGRVR